MIVHLSKCTREVELVGETELIADALDGVDMVIEAAPERIDLKLALMADIERHAPAQAIIATNDEREWRLGTQRIELRRRGLGDPA